MKKILYLILIIIFLIIISIIYSYIKIDITTYDIYNDKIPVSFNNYKIILLGDLHNRNISSKLNSIIEEEKPNIILMSGDMADASGSEYLIDLLKEINEYDIYYVMGNHELNLKNSTYNELRKEISNYVRIIDNEKIEICNDECINLYGLDYPLRYYSANNMYTLEESYITDTLGIVDNNKYNMLLTHNPLYYEMYSKWGSDLTMSGHVHGGIIKIPFVGGLLSPDFTFFPKYYEGNNKINNMNLIITRGLGYGGSMQIRVNNPAEVVVINLKVK